MRAGFFVSDILIFACTLYLSVTPAAGDEIRIRIPNPLPKIVKKVERAGAKVGDVVVRVAERVEEHVEDVRRELAPPPPPLPPQIPRVQRTPGHPPPKELLPSQALPPPVAGHRPTAQPAPIERQYQYPTDGSTRNAAAPTTPAARQNPATRPSTTPTAPLPPGPMPLHPPATGTSVDKAAKSSGEISMPAATPASPPAVRFGKPVPGRPGLVYPPGVAETPENMVDVRGMLPGTKVRDPVTKQVFLVP